MKITLETLPKATAQEVFDQVAEHLLKQKVRSVHSRDGCAYRGVNDTQCAAGCLISDEEYNHLWDERGYQWYSLVRDRKVPGAHCTLICDLQRVHDNYQPDLWLRELDKIADSYGLTPVKC